MSCLSWDKLQCFLVCRELCVASPISSLYSQTNLVVWHHHTPLPSLPLPSPPLPYRYLSMRRMRGAHLDTRVTQTLRPSVGPQGSAGGDFSGVSRDADAEEPMGRDRTISVLTDLDQLARTTVLTQVRSSPNRRATAVDRPPKRSEKILAAFKTSSLMRVTQPSPAQESPAPKDQERQVAAAEEEEEAKKKYIEEVMKQRSDTAVELPGLHFITRKDLYSLISSVGEEGQKFLRNRSLMELVQRVRANPVLFLK